MNMVIEVVGVSGCGKDYLLEQAKPRFVDKVYFAGFGELLYEKCHRQFGVRSRDELKGLDYEALRPAITNIITDIKVRQPAVITDHPVVMQRDSYIVNFEGLKLLSPATCLYVFAEPSQIRHWRKKDKERKRRIQSKQDIALHQNLLLSVIESYAAISNTRIVKIENSIEKTPDNVQIISDEVQRLIDMGQQGAGEVAIGR